MRNSRLGLMSALGDYNKGAIGINIPGTGQTSTDTNDFTDSADAGNWVHTGWVYDQPEATNFKGYKDGAQLNTNTDQGGTISSNTNCQHLQNQ